MDFIRVRFFVLSFEKTLGGFPKVLRLIQQRARFNFLGEANMNVKILSVLLVIVLVGFSAVKFQAQTCATAPVGLISTWTGDGNAFDPRSRYDGTIQNGVTYTSGMVGQAFDLAGNNGDRVLLGTTPDLRRQNMTIEAWVKRSSAAVVTNSPNGGGAVGVLFAFGQNGYAFYLKSDNRLTFGQVGQSEFSAPTLTITDTNWHHVAVTLNGPAFTAGTQTTFYLDGVAETTGYAPPFSFTTNAAIGTRGDGQTDNAFFGAIDELSIYDRPLTATEIGAIFAAGTAGKCKPFATKSPDNQVLWLAGDGDATDLTGNGNDGNLLNGATYQVGKVGQGFKFDGADDQITIPDNANQNGGTALTIEGWINPTTLPHGGTIVQKRTSGNIGGYVFEPTQPSGSGAPDGLQFVIMIGGVYSSLNPANVVSTNLWQHVAATYDGAFMRIYVNGVEVANKPQTGAIDNVAAPVVIGRNAFNGTGFVGGIDEVSLYQRALSATEVQSVAGAGLAGKYKVQSTVPADIAAWYPGDGNTNDLQAGNTATLLGGATYAVGKVGQAFSGNGTTAYVSAPSTPANDPTGTNGASMEAWVYFNQRPSDAGHPFWITSKDAPTFGDASAFHLRTDTNNQMVFQWKGGAAGSGGIVQAGVWYHIVGTFSPINGVRFYLNGVLISISNVFDARTPSNQPLEIGRYSGSTNGTSHFNGLIDEPAIYNRALTEAEIRDQYYAGSLGKYKGASNPTVQNTSKVGDATVTFGGVTTAGAVHQTPLDAALFPALPSGTNTGLNFDLSTSAVYSNPTVCLNASSFTPAQFANLRVYHLESGVWQNRTAGGNVYPNLCTSGLTSLSPFAIAAVTPTAANSSISGSVRSGKNGIANAIVTISGGNLYSPKMVRTNQFGMYKFDELEVGQIYTLTVSSRKHSFQQDTMIVNLIDEITDANFTATTR